MVFILLLGLANLENTFRICGDHSNEDYEFWVWPVINASLVIIFTYACNNYVCRCNVTCAQIGFMKSVYLKVCFTTEIANKPTLIGACCNTDGHYNFNKTC